MITSKLRIMKLSICIVTRYILRVALVCVLVTFCNCSQGDWEFSYIWGGIGEVSSSVSGPFEMMMILVLPVAILPQESSRSASLFLEITLSTCTQTISVWW